MKNDENVKIINQAYSLIKNEYVFHRSTMYLQGAVWEGVPEEDYARIDYKLKAIRQDFAKILTIMNVIDRTYSQYQQNTFSPTCFTVFNIQAEEELGCFIEYLFAKYRVILEYIQQIMEICIPPRFDDAQREQYEKLKKSHKKYKFLLRYVAESIDQKNCLLNMAWFQNIRIDRDFIIHDGATCLVFGDKENLLFKVMTTDVLDKEDDEPNVFYSTENGLIDYMHYWGLQISKLIVFVETIMKFLGDIGSIPADKKEQVDLLLSQGRNGCVDSDCVELRDKQDVLEAMLRKLIVLEATY